MGRPHQFIIPSLLVLLLKLSALTTHVTAQQPTSVPSRLALSTDATTTTDYTGQIRSFSEFGGGLNTDPPALICYTSGGFSAGIFDPTGVEIAVSTQGHPGPAATGSQLFFSGWAGNPVPNGDAIILHRGPNYFAPDGEYCCRGVVMRCLTLTSCPALTPVTNGMITYNSTTNQATYSCDAGYVLVGTSPITCSEGTPGSWSAAQPTCQLGMCPDLTPPTNGNPVTYSDNTLPRPTGATAAYSCVSGYQLTGNTMRSCTVSGWDGSDPVCTAICDELTLTNGIVTYNPTSSPRLEGTVATHSCDTGYMLSGGTMRTCENNRMWSGGVITCQLSCPDLPLPTNGQMITYSAPIPRPRGATATYSCITGYEVSGNTVRTCTAGGWDNSDPTCTPVDCGPPPNVTNGAVSTLSGTTFHQQASYSCQSGYTLTGVETRTCQTIGMWSSDTPTCQFITVSGGIGSQVQFTATNNAPISSLLIGEGTTALACHTELSSCCRDVDNPSGEALGQWVGPDGKAIPEANCGTDGFYITRDTNSISLNRAGNNTVGGMYCCNIPREGVMNQEFCINVQVGFMLSATPDPCVAHSIALGVILAVAVAVIVVLVTSLVITAGQLRNARTQLGKVDYQIDNVVYEEPTLTLYEEVDRKPAVGGTGPSAIELNQCPAYQVSGQEGRVDEQIYDN